VGTDKGQKRAIRYEIMSKMLRRHMLTEIVCELLYRGWRRGTANPGGNLDTESLAVSY
jgi:hypothetical protein